MKRKFISDNKIRKAKSKRAVPFETTAGVVVKKIVDSLDKRSKIQVIRISEISPTDVILLMVPMQLTQEQCHQYEDTIRMHLQIRNRILILTGGSDFQIISYT